MLLSSGYIAGGTLCGLLIGFLVMLLPHGFMERLDLSNYFGTDYGENDPAPKLVALAAFAVLAVILFRIGTRKSPELVLSDPPPEEASESES